MIYPLKMVMFIIVVVDLPIENAGSFHSYVNVFQRVVARTPFLSLSHITRCRWAKWASMTFRRLGASQRSHFRPGHAWAWGDLMG